MAPGPAGDVAARPPADRAVRAMVWVCSAGGLLALLALLLGVHDVPVSAAFTLLLSGALIDRGLRQMALRRSAGEVLVDCGPHASPGWLPFLVGVTALLAFRTGTMFGDDPGGRVGYGDVQEIALQVVFLGCLWASHLDGLRVRAAGVTGNLRCVPWSRVAAYQIVERSGHCELHLSWRDARRWSGTTKARVSHFDISPQHRAAVESALREKVGTA